jgi:hypothetical protein
MADPLARGSRFAATLAAALVATGAAPPPNTDARAAALLSATLGATLVDYRGARFREVRAWSGPVADPAAYSVCGYIDAADGRGGRSGWSRFAARLTVPAKAGPARAELFYEQAPPEYQARSTAQQAVDRTVIGTICAAETHTADRLVSSDWSGLITAHGG